MSPVPPARAVPATLPSFDALMARPSTRRRTARRLGAAALLAAGALLAFPAHADAQLMKRIRQAAQQGIADRAVDAAVRKVGGDSTASAPAEATNAPAGAAPATAGHRAPVRATGPEKLEITAERVELFLVSLAPRLEALKAEMAYAEAEQRTHAYNACWAAAQQKQMEIAMRGGTIAQPTRAQEAEIERIGDQMAAINERMLAALTAHNQALVQTLTDSSATLSARLRGLQYPGAAKACGGMPPTMPPRPPSSERIKPTRIDGMSPTQYGRLRERLALHLLAPERRNDLTAAEKAAIDARAKDLAPVAAGFRSGTLEWGSWSDVWSAWKQ